MTGFARVEDCDEENSYSVEIKSVNGRFIDLRFKIPDQYNYIAPRLRTLIQGEIKRGGLDIVFHCKRNLEHASHVLDQAKIESFLKFIAPLALKNNLSMTINPVDFLRPEFMAEKNGEQDENLNNKIEKLFKKAVEKLKKSRGEEGAKLLFIMQSHVEKYRTCFNEICLEKDSFKQDLEQRLLKKLKEFGPELPVDRPRFLQEIVYYMEKMDVDEEIDRIKTHLEKLDDILLHGGEVGRQIDFIIQELVRETNTIGSKTFQNKISENIVQMKIVLEKIREQGLNIE